MADVVAELYFRHGELAPQSHHQPGRDIFLLSKGHAAPGHYAALAARGYFPNARLDRLRRWDGLPGHSHVTTPGVDGNTGSLAMGMSKAVGFAIAKARYGLGGDVYCMAGDGELQEGQAWEAMLSAASFACPNFTLIIDANGVQTDQFVDDILVYRDLPGSIRALGFALAECDGHDVRSIREALAELAPAERPKCLYAHTIKGRGVSYMEHTEVLKQPDDRYVWHNRPPNAALLSQALSEILNRSTKILETLGVQPPNATPQHKVPLEPPATGVQGKPLVPAFAEGLIAAARANDKIVVLDADLEEDCGLTPFRREFPQRFFELGIMEQHMCSAASALSALGYIPVINSYAAFLTSRSNEQIYNLATDKNARFLLVGHLAGVIPATPGMSHQAFRDIGCLRSVPGLVLYQPMGPEDCRRIVERFGRGEMGGMVYLRVAMAPSAAQLPAGEATPPIGRSQVIREGHDAVLISAGPVMLGEAVAAAETLSSEGIRVEVRNHPWLAAFDPEMLAELAGRDLPIVVAEDHHRLGGLGEGLWAAMAAAGHSIRSGHVALDDLPDTGFRTEALEGMGISRKAIANIVRRLVSSNGTPRGPSWSGARFQRART
jgi:transketolase